MPQVLWSRPILHISAENATFGVSVHYRYRPKLSFLVRKYSYSYYRWKSQTRRPSLKSAGNSNGALFAGGHRDGGQGQGDAVKVGRAQGRQGQRGERRRVGQSKGREAEKGTTFVHPFNILYVYRVTRQVVLKVLLTSKSRLHFSIDTVYKNRYLCFSVNKT